MNKLFANYIEKTSFITILGQYPAYTIACNNWNYENDVDVKFNIGHDDSNIFIYYWVNEPNVKAIHKEINEPVYEDSCVEFFISFDNIEYYNFEFNCIGNILGQYGKIRDSRTFMNERLLKEITTIPSLGRNTIEIYNRKTDWTLAVTIPKKVFIYTDESQLNAGIAKCNFYKCGDKLPSPHYLSWNPIKIDKPNFHRIDYFGEIQFNK